MKVTTPQHTILLLTLLVVAGVGWGVWKFARRGRKKEQTPSTEVNYESFITSMKAVGELSVFRVMTKEVITASDHWLDVTTSSPAETPSTTCTIP